MRDHESRFHSRPLRKKCRKTLTLIRVNEAIRAPFAYAHQIGDCDRCVIESKSKRRPVKIPARDHITGLGKHKRIVCRRCRLNQ
jgi:hypothetical protein